MTPSEFVALVARMTIDGECEQCGTMDCPYTQGTRHNRPSHDRFEQSPDDAIEALGNLIATARSIA